jgi:MYXO-CTERM domain-containing protein
VDDLTVSVHPAPDGRRALVVLHEDGPEAMIDTLHWVEVPDGVVLAAAPPDEPTAVSPSCGPALAPSGGATAALVPLGALAALGVRRRRRG